MDYCPASVSLLVPGGGGNKKQITSNSNRT